MDYTQIPLESLTKQQLLAEASFQHLSVSVNKNKSQIAETLRRSYLHKQTTTFTPVVQALIKTPPAPTKIPDNDQNPYLSLNEMLITLILKERGIQSTGSLSHRQQELRAIDQIRPEWIDICKEASPTELMMLTMGQLVIYAILHGVDIIKLYNFEMKTRRHQEFSISRDQLRKMIACHVIYPTPIERPVPRPVQSVEMSVDDSDVLLDLTREGFRPTQIDDELLSEVFGIFESDEETFVQQLIEYPIRVSNEEYHTIHDSSADVLQQTLLDKGMIKWQLLFLHHEELVFTITRGYYPPNLDFDAWKERYQDLMRQSEDALNKLIWMYGVAGWHQPVRFIAREPPSPLETVIRLYPRVSVGELVDRIGMTYPLGLPPHQRREYFWDNVASYRDIMERTPDLPLLTIEELKQAHRERIEFAVYEQEFFERDKLRIRINSFTEMELMKMLGLAFHFKSRNQFLDQVMRASTKPTFFLPFRRVYPSDQPLKEMEFSNSETTLLSSTRDVNLFLIGYGTLDQYRAYEMEELLQLFSMEEQKNGVEYEFRHPENPRSIFTRDQIKDLAFLLTPYSEAGVLIKLIERCLPRQVLNDEAARRWRDAVMALPEEEQKTLRRMWSETLEAAMYMRHWQGPGHPYPVSKEDAHQGDQHVSIPEEVVKEALGKVFITFGQLDTETQTWIRELPTKDWVKNDYVAPSYDVGSVVHLLEETANGKHCIRNASNYLVASVAYYLKVLFREEVPNLDMNKLDRIW